MAAEVATTEKMEIDPIKKVEEDISLLNLTSKDFYWDGYSHFRTHEQLLKDNTRVNSFKKAILRNKHLFQDKIVLDVGAGTGILSMFAAQAGAKHVYAVECAAIVNFTEQIIKANKFENVITVIRGKIEEVTLPVDKVDIIVCSWAGYFLLLDSLIQPLLFARDKWLAEGGLIFPDKAYFYICGVEDISYKRQKLDWWRNVENYNFSCMKDLVIKEPIIDTINTGAIVTDTYFLAAVDLNIAKYGEDIKINAPFTLKSKKRDTISALVAYFDLEFSKCHRSVFLSSAPGAEWTGYKQTFFYLKHDLEVNKGDTVTGAVEISMKATNNRAIDINVSYNFARVGISNSQPYHLLSN